MVHYAPLIGTVALAASMVAAAPMPYDSSNNQYSSSSDSSNQYSSSSDSSNQYSSSSDSSNQYSSSAYQSQGYSSSTSTDAATSTSSAYGSSYSSSSYNNGYNGGYSSSSTSAELATSTSSAYVSTPSYGSGSSYWGGSGYEDCVQQCMAEFGGGMTSVSNTDSGSSNTDTGYSGSTGTGATHTVIVAPSQGVLRYVPFYTTANVGDTVQFVWHANEHTVTKSSQLELCNKTSEAPVFASGEHNASFTFSQVINDTNPIYYYCGTPTHCEKGMFGMINAPNTTSSGGSSVSDMLPSMLGNDSMLTAMWAYQQNVSNGNSMADSWGSSIDMSSMPSWSQSYMAQNVLYTRTFLAANPEVMNADGTIDMSKAQAWSFPRDIANQLSAATAAQGASSTSTSAPSSSTASTSTASTASHTSGAGSITAPRVAAALVAVAVTLFAL
jgi:plastocyanin